MTKLSIVDMFCGGGGESTGLIEAAHDYDFDVNLSAINHWERAIETHSANYPFAEHLRANVQDVKPESLKASVNTDLLWASPGCQHFSVARGGKPRDEQMRSPAWEVLRFVETLRPKRVIIENVPEFQSWGRLIRMEELYHRSGVKHSSLLSTLCNPTTIRYRIETCVPPTTEHLLHGKGCSYRRYAKTAENAFCGQSLQTQKPWTVSSITVSV